MSGTPPAQTPGTPRPLSERVPHAVAMGLRRALASIAHYVLPKRKTFVRSLLFALLGMLPVFVLLVVKAPLMVIPFLLLVGYLAHLSGLTAEVSKQLRWMKRMSSNGPIFWALASAKRTIVRWSRWYYGDKLDVLPQPLSAFGTSARASEVATVKWIAPPSSDFSRHGYDVQIRATRLVEAAAGAAKAAEEQSRVEEVDASGQPVAAAASGGTDKAEAGWMTLIEGHSECELLLKPLVPGTEYEARVRATNSKGSSPWRTIAFTTKRKPLLLHNGAGDEGPAYRWLQSLNEETISVICYGLPAHTKARNIEVTFKPTKLRVAAVLPPAAQTLLDGDLFAAIVPNDSMWELKDAADGEGRELHLTLAKLVTRKAAEKDAPLWPQLLKTHPEIDMSKVKRAEKSLEEVMAELNKADPNGMNKVNQLKKDL